MVLAARTVCTGEQHEYGIRGQTRAALPGSLEETALLVCNCGVKALVVRLDITQPESVQAALEEALAASP